MGFRLRGTVWVFQFSRLSPLLLVIFVRNLFSGPFSGL